MANPDNALFNLMRLAEIGKLRPPCEVRFVIPKRTLQYEVAQSFKNDTELKQLLPEIQISEESILRAIDIIKKFAKVRQAYGNNYDQFSEPIAARKSFYSSNTLALGIVTTITLQLCNRILEKLLDMDFVENLRSILLMSTFIRLFISDILTTPERLHDSNQDQIKRREIIKSAFIKNTVIQSANLVLMMEAKVENVNNQEAKALVQLHLNSLDPVRLLNRVS